MAYRHLWLGPGCEMEPFRT